MYDEDGRDQLIQAVLRFYVDEMVPGAVLPMVVRMMPGRPRENLLRNAVHALERRVERILASIPVLNYETVTLRIPGPRFLAVQLMSEYLQLDAENIDPGSQRGLSANAEERDALLHRLKRDPLKDGKPVQGPMLPADSQAEEGIDHALS